MIESTSENSSTQKEQPDPYVQIGESLRKAREAAGLLKADVTRTLRLPSSVIDDIESGRVQKISALYRRGYITNYAGLLGLDASQLLALTKTEELPELRHVLPVRQSSWKLERYLRIATYVLVTTVVVPPLLYFFVQGGSRIMEREPVIISEEEVIGAEVATPGERSGRNRIARVLSLEESGAGGQSEPVGHMSASALPLNSVRSIREGGINTDSGDSSTAIEPDPGLLEVDGLGELSELAIEVSDDSWVEIYAADGQRLEYDLLRAGQSRRYKAPAPFQLLLGRANAVQIILNGERVTYEGHDRGDVARFELLASGDLAD